METIKESREKIVLSKLLLGVMPLLIISLLAFQVYYSTQQSNKMNAKIDSLTSRLTVMDDKLRSIDVDVSSINSTVDTINSSVDDTISTIEDIKSTIDILSFDVSDIQRSMAFR